MNILMIGRNDPAGTMIAFANAINRYSNHRARVVTLETRYNVNYEHDIELPRIHNDDFGEIEDLLKHADIIHFHMLIDENHTIGPLLIANYTRGKQILHHHHGHPDLFPNAARYSDTYAKLGRKVIVSTPDLLRVVKGSEWQPNLIPINDCHFLPRNDHLGRQHDVRIVQSPTRKWHKHTAEFRHACAKVRSACPYVSSHILEGMTYVDTLKFKRRCHISFDHMNGWFGIASLESLAQGVPTVAGLDEWNIERIKDFTQADALPWILARNEDELYERLLALAKDPELRVSHGKASRTFMENHWSERAVLDRLLDTYQNL